MARSFFSSARCFGSTAPLKIMAERKTILDSVRKLASAAVDRQLSRWQTSNLNNIYGKESDDRDLYPDIDDDTRERIFNRNPFANAAITQMTDDIWGSGFRIMPIDGAEESSVDALRKAWDEIDRRTQLTIKLKDAWLESAKFGFGLVFLGFNDAGEELREPVRRARGMTIESAAVRSSRQIKSFQFQDNPELPRFGEIEFYIPYADEIGKREELRNQQKEEGDPIHYTRVLHVVQQTVNNNPRGVSVIDPAYNALRQFDEITWGMSQSYTRWGVGFPVIEHEMNADKEVELRKDMRFHSRDVNGWLIRKGKATITWNQAPITSPKDFLEPAMKVASAALGVPMQLVLGTDAGAISGSETNIKEYYGRVRSKQDNRAKPLVRDLIRRLQEFKVLPDGEYDIEFPDPQFKDEDKEAQVDRIIAESASMLVEAGILTPNEARIKYELSDEELPDGLGNVPRVTVPAVADYIGVVNRAVRSQQRRDARSPKPKQ